MGTTAEATVTVFVAVLDWVGVEESVTVSVTVNVPAVAYACVGFATALVPPSPKVHA